MDSAERIRSLKRHCPELLIALDRLQRKVQSYGYYTDCAEMFEQVGLTILILRHQLPENYVRRDMLSITILSEIVYLPYSRRKRVVNRLYRLYASYLEGRRHEKRRSSDHR